MPHFEVHQVREFFAVLESAGVTRLTSHLDPISAASRESDLSFEDLGVDSLTLLEMSVKLEEAFSVSLSPKRIGLTKTVMGLYSLIQNA